jgi:hypothetical protein
MSPSKKLDLYMDFAAGVYLPEAQNPVPHPTSTHCTLVYSILIQTGKGRRGERGGIEPERRLEGQQFTAGSKIPI